MCIYIHCLQFMAFYQLNTTTAWSCSPRHAYCFNQLNSATACMVLFTRACLLFLQPCSIFLARCGKQLQFLHQVPGVYIDQCVPWGALLLRDSMGSSYHLRKAGFTQNYRYLTSMYAFRTYVLKAYKVYDYNGSSVFIAP